jgi:hypothetical protein
MSTIAALAAALTAAVTTPGANSSRWGDIASHIATTLDHIESCWPNLLLKSRAACSYAGKLLAE